MGVDDSSKEAPAGNDAVREGVHDRHLRTEVTPTSRVKHYDDTLIDKSAHDHRLVVDTTPTTRREPPSASDGGENSNSSEQQSTDR